MRFQLKDAPLVWILSGGLAVWRITSILQKEEIASPLRSRIGIVETGEESDYWIYPDNFIGKVFYCFWCGSVWAGMLVTVLLVVFPPLILPFTLSTIAILIKDWLESDHGVEYIQVEEESDDNRADD